MKRTAPLLLLLVATVGCPGGEPPAALVKVAHAQTKPDQPPEPAAMALRPQLEQGTTWSQTVKVATDRSMGSAGMRGRFDLAKKRVLSSEGVLTMDFGSTKITHDVSVRAD